MELIELPDVLIDLPDCAVAFALRDPVMCRLVQHRLGLWHHARKCWRRQKKRRFFGKEVSPCSVAHCGELVTVIDHIRFCRVYRCIVPHCPSTKRIITHWYDCSGDCRICNPFRHLDVKLIRPCNLEKHAKPWHLKIEKVQRLQVVALLKECTILRPGHHIFRAMGIEAIAYHKQATSLTEYYRLIGDKMWQNEFDGWMCRSPLRLRHV